MEQPKRAFVQFEVDDKARREQYRAFARRQGKTLSALLRDMLDSVIGDVPVKTT